MKKQLRKIISGLIMLVFLAGILPKEYLHELLYSHHDTVDVACKKGDFAISKEHTHCSFLWLVFSPFVAAEKQYFIATVFPCQNGNYIFVDYHYQYATSHPTITLRGPPSIPPASRC